MTRSFLNWSGSVSFTPAEYAEPGDEDAVRSLVHRAREAGTTLTPTAPDLELPRTINALVGGIVGLLVVLVLAPLNPLRTVRRVADPALAAFARELTASAQALDRGDARAAEEVLDRLRAAPGPPRRCWTGCGPPNRNSTGWARW